MAKQPKRSRATKTETSTEVFQRDKIRLKLQIRDLNWTEKQKSFIELAMNKDTKVIFVNGPSGTSKTLLAMYCGLQYLNKHALSDMILIRTAVESADSKLGYLPGSADEKMNVYSGPFADKLLELLPETQIHALKADERFTLVPVNFARGLSWTGKFILGDEMQNATRKELQTLMTRVGDFSKVILAGDSDQCDLPKGKSGWVDVLNGFNTEEAVQNGIHVFEFNEEDIMRSELCKFIVKTFKAINTAK